jgi:hypothetical protein
MNRNDPQFYAGDFKAPEPNRGRSLSLEDTSEFSRPTWATPNDVPVGQDELGNTVFQGLGGRTYIAKPNPLYGQERGSYIRSGLEAIPPMEDWSMSGLGEAAAKGAKAIGEILWDVVDTPRAALAGERVPTIGDAVDVAGFSATGGMAGFGVPEGALRANVPMFRRRTGQSEVEAPATPTKIDPFDEPISWSQFNADPPSEFEGLTFRQWNDFIESDELPIEFLQRNNIEPSWQNEYFMINQMDNRRLQDATMGRFLSEGMDDDLFIQGEGIRSNRGTYAEFRSPVKEVLEDLEFPSKGLKGSQFLKELKDNPTVRNSEVAAMDLQIDPMKRYTREELSAIVDENLFTTQALGAGPRHRSMQRQPVLDPEVDYEEIMINASRQGGKPMFEPKYGETHYDPNTIGHARVSIREGVDDWTGMTQRYLLVEEMQSDLIQKGYRPKSSKYEPPSEADFDRLYDVLSRNADYDSDYLSPPANRLYKIVPKEILYDYALNPTENVFSEILDNIPMGYIRGMPDYMVRDGLRELLSELVQTPKPVGAPPVTSTTESTRAIVQSIMAYADQNNVGEIVFPPLERIAAQRFTPGTEAYNKAIKPGSGFHQTYVTSLNKVLKELEKELGANAVRVSERPISYEPMGHKTGPRRREITEGQAEQDLAEISFYRDLNNLEAVPTSIVDRLSERYGDAWWDASSVENLLDANQPVIKDLPSTGISISIPVQQDIDFSRPRFYKGGLVTRTKQALGET